MKASQIGNIYLLELVATAMPGQRLEELAPDLLDRNQARGARAFVMGCLTYMGWEAGVLAWEATKAARAAMKKPDPLAAIMEAAAAHPLLTAEQVAAGWWRNGLAPTKALMEKLARLQTARDEAIPA